MAAAASTLAMALLYQPEADPSRVYFGTDTRAFSLLIGAWLAFVWPSGALGGKVAPGARWALDGIGIAAFLGLAALVALSNGYDGFQYRGGILLCSVLSAVVIAIVVHPASRFARFWSLAPLVWVGKRSYGMYLWHFSILLLMTNQNATEAAPLWWNAIELVLIVGVSAASYTFIENPVRKGAIGAFVRRVRAGEVTVPRTLARHAVPAVAGCAITVVAAVGLVIVPPTNAVEGADAAAEQVDAEAQAQQNAQTAADRREAYDLLMIGDSVSVRCENIFPDYFPNGCLDAVVGRTMQKGQETYDRYRDMGAVGDRVVVALGTNGLVTLDQANAFIDDIDSDKRIWLVNTRSNEDWVTATNDALAQAAAQHDNVELIDWYAYSAGNDNLFSGDGKHLTAEAAQDYMTLIKQSVDGTDVDTNADTGSGADGGTPAGGDVSDGSTASA